MEDLPDSTMEEFKKEQEEAEAKLRSIKKKAQDY